MPTDVMGLFEGRSPIAFDIGKITEAVNKVFEAKYPEYAIPEPPDELFEMLDYLPEEFQDETEEQYIDALMLATQTSYENGLYQFAYVQLHMLFMTAVYYALLKVSLLHKEEMDTALFYLMKDRFPDFYAPSNTKGGKLYFGSFSIINESDVFMLLRIVGMDSDLQGQLKKLVEKRNVYAHANGQLRLTSEDLFLSDIKEYNRKIKAVYALLKGQITELYFSIVTDPTFYDPEIRAYTEPREQIEQELVRQYALSRHELNWLRKIKLDTFRDCEGSEQIRELHKALIDYYKTLDEE